MNDRVAYDFAVLRVVPHPYIGAFTPVGVVLHARTAEFLEARLITDPAVLRARFPGMDVERLLAYLRTFEAIVRGDASAGPVALLPPSERFHSLTAPRSDVLQPSPVHAGVCHEPASALDELFERLVVP